MFSTFVDTLEGRAEFMSLVEGRSSLDPSLTRQMQGRQAVRVRGGQVVSRRALAPAPVVHAAKSVNLDIAALAVAFAGRLRDADPVAFTEAQATTYAEALQAEMPRSRRDLYSLSREIFLSGRQYVDLFNREFAEVFGAHEGTDRYQNLAPAARTAVAGMR
jgi:uncharacterized protein with von Willebrand factor type A (vWA) domain